jgi:hypothetical protein
VAWEEKLARLAAYKAAHGNCSVPGRWAEDPRLASWVRRQLDCGELGTGLTAERAARLTALGFEWIDPPQLAKDIPVAGMGTFRCPHCSQIVLSVRGATARKWRLDGCSGVGGTQCKKVSIEMVEEREATQVGKDARAAAASELARPRQQCQRNKPNKPELPMSAAEAWAAADAEGLAGLDEGLLSLTPSNLLYMENPYSYKKYRCRMTARPRISRH